MCVELCIAAGRDNREKLFHGQHWQCIAAIRGSTAIYMRHTCGNKLVTQLIIKTYNSLAHSALHYKRAARVSIIIIIKCNVAFCKTLGFFFSFHLLSFSFEFLWEDSVSSFATQTVDLTWTPWKIDVCQIAFPWFRFSTNKKKWIFLKLI